MFYHMHYIMVFQVFEGERSYNGKIFKSNLHTKRLKKSCEYLDFKLPIIEEKVDQLKHDLLEKNNLIDAYVRPFVGGVLIQWVLLQMIQEFIWL